jgi:heme/copper-type cytochrome/quinol oxidase subunit 1
MYSERLGNIHLWGTVIGGYGWVTFQMIQGLMGAPRRWANWDLLDDSLITLTHVTLGFLVILVLAQLVFAYNLYKTLRSSPFEQAREVPAS